MSEMAGEMSTYDEKGECSGCGSTLEDRNKERADDDRRHVWKCVFCSADKCSMCDMGNDVECLGCGGEP